MPRAQSPPAAKANQRLFLSYARADDIRDPLVGDLHRVLVRAGFDVWWDRVDMPSRGRTFQQEIRDAIDECDRLVLLVGPAALSSDHVRQEWQYALVAGKVVNPLLRAGPHDVLPPELGNLHCPDASDPRTRGEAVLDLLRVLRQPPPELGELFGPIPEVPDHFQPPVQPLSDLADQALIDTRGTRTRRSRTAKPGERATVVYGMPGAGKSVLAAAFGRATEVRRAFEDGVVWVQAGRELTVERLTSAICDALKAGARVLDRGFSRDHTTRLRKALKKSNCLIIVDDLWSHAPIEPLLNALGPRSRLVVTTRLAELRSTFAARALAVEGLSMEAARRLLADWCDRRVEQLPPEATEVARECGCLPLALALCGAMAAHGLGWDDLLTNLRSANLAFLQKTIRNYPYPGILRSMSVSVSHLARTQKRASKRYLELAVFPPGTVVPVAAIETLWARTGPMTASQSHQLLVTLEGHSLLRVGGPAREHVTLHDLQWDYLAAVTPERRRLNRLLISAYDARYPGGFHTAPDGDYIVDRASWHLAAAGDHRRLYRLIDRDWLDRKCSREALRRSFLDDLDRVVAAARCRGSRDVSELVRACLIRSNVQALAGSCPGDALYVLARCGALDEAMDATAIIRGPVGQPNAYYHIVTALKEKGDAASASELALQALDLGSAVQSRRGNMLAYTALLLAELNDTAAPRHFARARAACLARGKTPSVYAATRTAIAAFLLGRQLDADGLMALAERLVMIEPEEAESLFEGWIRLGKPAHAVQAAERLQAGDRSGVQFLRPAALALARAGHFDEASTVEARIRRAPVHRRREEPWWDCQIAARLGRPEEAMDLARRADAHWTKNDQLAHRTELLTVLATELAESGHRRQARALADRALKSARKLRRATMSGSIHHVEPGHSEPDLLAGVACACLACGRNKRAVALAREAIGRGHRFTWHARTLGNTKAALAEALVEIGQLDRARQIATGIEDTVARREAFERLARVLAAKQRYGECLQLVMRPDQTRPSSLVADILESLSPSILEVAARELGPAVTDEHDRLELGCHLAWQSPGAFAGPTQAALAAHAAYGGASAVHFARALHRDGRYADIDALLRTLWRALPGPRSYARMHDVGFLAELLTLAEHPARRAGPNARPARWRALMRDAGHPDDEFAACGLSRVALAFAEAGWLDEARTVLSRALSRAQLMKQGTRPDRADAYARLARVTYLLHASSRAAFCVKEALRAGAGASGGSDLFGDSDKTCRALGALLGHITTPSRALTIVVAAARAEGHLVSGHALIGLYEHVLSFGGVDAARQLAAAITSHGQGSPWLTVRMAALHHARRHTTSARGLLADALQEASKEGPDAVLDVISHGARILAGTEHGRALERVADAFLQVQGWRGMDSPDSQAGMIGRSGWL